MAPSPWIPITSTPAIALPARRHLSLEPCRSSEQDSLLPARLPGLQPLRVYGWPELQGSAEGCGANCQALRVLGLRSVSTLTAAMTRWFEFPVTITSDSPLKRRRPWNLWVTGGSAPG